MAFICVRDHMEKCTTWEEGEKLFNIVQEPLSRGESVTISFSGVNNLGIEFLNGFAGSLRKIKPQNNQIRYVRASFFIKRKIERVLA